MKNLTVERLKSLPIHEDVVWQAVWYVPGSRTIGLVPGASFAVGLWLDPGQHRIGPSESVVSPQDATPERLLLSMLKFSEENPEGSYLPGRVEFLDRELARAMRPLLGQVGIAAKTVQRLPEMEEALASLEERLEDAGHRAMQNHLFADGTDAARLRALALATREFHLAAPWLHLSDMDLVRVASPAPPPGMEYMVVMGQADITYGLAFFADPDEHDRALAEGEEPIETDPLPRNRISLTIVEHDRLPAAEQVGYELHAVPPTEGRLFPLLILTDEQGRSRPPTAEETTFLEGLLRAIARSTTAQMDGGRWSVDVGTLDGKVTYTLELSYLLAPPSQDKLTRWGEELDPRTAEIIPAYLQRYLDDHPETSLDEVQQRLAAVAGKAVPLSPWDVGFGHPRNDRERAQDLCFEAYARHGYHRKALARQALAIDPDCLDALLLLAEEDEAEDAYALLERAVETGRRTLDPAAIQQEYGSLWSHLGGRAFVRALSGLAAQAIQYGKADIALALAEETLALDPADHRRMRFMLLQLYFSRGDLARAAELVANWPCCRGSRRDAVRPPAGPLVPAPEEEDGTLLAFLDMLLAYADPDRRDTDAPRLLKEARRRNRYVLPLALHDRRPPRTVMDDHRPGKGQDAYHAAFYLRGLIPLVPGARQWLKKQVRRKGR